MPLCMCFAALLRNALENLVLLRQMLRIRGYYRSLIPRSRPVLRPRRRGGAILSRDGDAGAAGVAGGDAVHRASVIAAINSIVGRVGVALLVAKVASGATGAALAVGIATAVVLFGLHLLDQQQRAASVVLRAPAQATAA
jgi:hypothetical protein